MKKIHKTISIILSGVIVGLGFGSCGSQKLAQQIKEKENVLLEKDAVVSNLTQRFIDLQRHHEYLKSKIDQLKHQTPLVYAPPVPNRDK